MNEFKLFEIKLAAILADMAKPSDWKSFLKDYASAFNENEWLGNPGASEANLLKTEQRLKVTLPPSYREFLQASNGWRNASEFIPALRAVDKIKWFRKEHKDWVNAYVEPQQGMDSPISDVDYFTYTPEGSAKFDVKHLAQTLCISDVGDSAVVLLNPMVIWPDGEWEAWFFANWIPGAIRYRSFGDWMQQELAKKLRETPLEPAPITELPVVYRDPPGKEPRRIVKREEIPPLNVVLKNLNSSKEKVQVKAVKQLSRIGGEVTIGALIHALKTTSFRDVRWEAAEGLGRLKAREAVDALIDAARNNPWGDTNEIRALGQIGDEKAAQFLIGMIERNEFNCGVAVHALANRGDARAIPHLIRILLSKDPNDQHTGNIAGRFIADFQNEEAYRALEPLMSHTDREVRRRVINGVGDLAYCGKDKSTKLKARELLQRCLKTEPDEGLRRNIEVSIEIS